MQIFVTCSECEKDTGRPADAFLAAYYEDRVVQLTCSRGHRTALVLQAAKFQVLLESGVNALIDGYTLEAAATFAAALERFREFCVEVFCAHQQMPQPLFDQMFGQMSRQSERQLGAFMVLYAAQTGEVYKPNQKIDEFRNAVIHKGRIPTPDETADFCEMVFQAIQPVWKLLLTDYMAAYNEVMTRDRKLRWGSVPDGTPTSSIYASLWSYPAITTFKETLEVYKKVREQQRHILIYKSR
jgi:hypothetical protein